MARTAGHAMLSGPSVKRVGALALVLVQALSARCVFCTNGACFGSFGERKLLRPVP